MKTRKNLILILILILLLLFTIIVKGQKQESEPLIWSLSRMPAAELPISTGLKQTWKKGLCYGFNQNMAPLLQYHSYEDLGLTKEFALFCGGVIYGWAESKYGYNILLISMGEVDRYRLVIGTFTKAGNLIDTLECEAFFTIGNNPFYTKEFSLNSDQQLIVCQLESKEVNPVFITKPFESYHAQRVDTYYQINSEGKIVPQKRKLYKPRVYDVAYIKDGKKRLLDGDEDFEREEVILKE